jgi:hypothetical protein
MPGVTLERARAAKAAVLRCYEALGTVVGVGVTRAGDDYAVKVNLREPPPPHVELPAVVDGVPVRVEVVGTIRKREERS